MMNCPEYLDFNIDYEPADVSPLSNLNFPLPEMLAQSVLADIDDSAQASDPRVVSDERRS
jgi:hypothetical protein